MTGQNRSSAVMQQRAEPHDSLDYFPTPPWATRALCEILKQTHPLHLFEAWEPACGEGHMARPLGEYFDRVHATDVHDYRAAFANQCSVCDFLIDWLVPHQLAARNPDWIITNPPFRQAEKFIRQARDRSEIGCAMFVRGAFLEGQARYLNLFSKLPPARILQFTERVPLLKGRLDRDGSTATAYCWLVWEHGHSGPPVFDWIAPCRKALERGSDYGRDLGPPEPLPLLEGGP